MDYRTILHVGMEGRKTAPTPDQTKQTAMWIQKYFKPNVATVTRWPLLVWATFISCPKLTWSVSVTSMGLGARVAKMSDMEGSKTAPTPDQMKQTAMWIQKYFEPNMAAATRWPLLARATFISCPKLTWSVSVSSLGLGLGLQKYRIFFVLIFKNILVFRFLPEALYHQLYLT